MPYAVVDLCRLTVMIWPYGYYVVPGARRVFVLLCKQYQLV